MISEVFCLNYLVRPLVVYASITHKRVCQELVTKQVYVCPNGGKMVDVEKSLQYNTNSNNTRLYNVHTSMINKKKTVTLPGGVFRCEVNPKRQRADYMKRG